MAQEPEARSHDSAALARFIDSLGSSFWQRWEFPYRHMGASVVDASLQAGVNYMTVVEPRVRAIRQKYPHIKTTSAFIDLADQVGLAALMNWTHAEKPQRAREALALFKTEGVETEAGLFTWIEQPENKPKLMACRGVGPKTFDYYRLIAGHKTFAIDRHLFGFLRLAGMVCSDYSTAHQVFTETASTMGRDSSDLDYSIWKFMSERPVDGPSRRLCKSDRPSG